MADLSPEAATAADTLAPAISDDAIGQFVSENSGRPQREPTGTPTDLDSFVRQYAGDALTDHTPSEPFAQYAKEQRANLDKGTLADTFAKISEANENAVPVLKAFAWGGKQFFGDAPLGSWSEEAAKAAKSVGIYDDAGAKHDSILSGFNRTYLGPPATALLNTAELAFRSAGYLAGGIGAATAYTVGKGLSFISPELGRRAGQEIMGMTESGAGLLGSPEELTVAGTTRAEALAEGAAARFPNAPGARLMRGPELLDTLPENVEQTIAIREAARRSLPRNVARARDLGVIGGGEGEYQGYRSQDFNTATLNVILNNAPPTAPIPTTPAADVHTVARQLEPDLFNEYDAIQQDHATLFNFINDMRRQRADSEAVAAARQAVDDAQAKGEKLGWSKGRVKAVDDANAALAEALSANTPEMATVQRDMMALDERMRNLAPQVYDAYQRASDHIGTSEAQPAVSTPETQHVIHIGQEQPVQVAPQATAQPETAPLGEIGRHVSESSVKAGLSQEQADAVGAVWQAYYEQRAARFGGKKGTAEELFAREAPEIVGGKTKKTAPGRLEYAQGEAVPDVQQQINDAIDARVEQSMTSIRMQFRPGTEAYDRAVQRARDLAADWINQPEGRDYLEAQAEAKGDDAYTARLKDYLARSYESVAEGQPFHANVNRLAAVYEQGGKRGKITFQEGAAPVIRIMKSGDVTTLFHESGHAWLEDLINDAKDKDAPQQLRDDAAAVLKWLGVDNWDTVETKTKVAAHEKFARGFERYVSEGTAPSPALARVFAKLKDWIGKIYAAVRNSPLKDELPENMRAVMDRMLSTQPQRTVYAPEREAPTMADRHAEMAETTQAIEAEPQADQIRAEADALALQHPEIADELGINATGEVGGREPAGAETNGHGAAGQPPARTTGGRPATGTVGARGGEAAPEGAGGGAAGEPPTAGGSEGPGRYWDKAGNIRLDNINAPEDIKAAMREAAMHNVDFVAERRGVVTEHDIEEYANAMGLEARDINLQRLRQMSVEDGIPLAARILVGRKMMVDAVTDWRDFARNMGEDPSDSEVAQYANLRQRAFMVMGTVSGVTAEWGRAGHAFRKVGGFEEAKAILDLFQSETGKNVKQLRDEAKALRGLDTPQKAAKFGRDMNKPGAWDMLTEFLINNYISGFLTHIKYTIGNTLLALMRAIPETAGEAALGAFRQHVLGQAGAERAYFGEVGAQLRAMWESGNPFLTAKKLYHITNNAKDWAEAREQIWQLTRGSRDGVMAAFRAAIDGKTVPLPGEGEITGMSAMVAPTPAIPDFVKTGRQIAGRDVYAIPLGTAVRLPSRMVAMIHSYHRAMGYEQWIARYAYRQAVNEGLTGDALATRVSELRDNPDETMMRNAVDNATEQTLMGKGGEAQQALSRLVNTRMFGIKPLKVIDPFVNVVGNVLREWAVMRTPLALADPELRADLFGKNGGIRQNAAWSRVAVGTAMGLTGFGLAMEGLLNGAGPADPKQEALYRRVHGMPNAARIGDWWYDFHRFGPAVGTLFAGANIYETAHIMANEDFQHAMGQATFLATQTLVDESGLRGISDAVRAIDDPYGFGERYTRSELSSLLPYSVGMSQAARAVDPYQRQINSIGEAFRAKVPWESETLFPRLDWTGQPLPSNEQGVGGWTAIYDERARNDPVEQAMLRLGVYPALPPKKLRGVQLTEQQHFEYAQIAGRLSYQLMQGIVQPGFEQQDPKVQFEQLKDALKKGRQAAEARILSEDAATSAALGQESIMDKAADAKAGGRPQYPAGVAVEQTQW